MPLSTKRHEYQLPPPNSDWQRSPCPALNALANHGYIPHSGRSIPFFQLVHALRIVYNCSTPLAWLLSVVGFLWCGHLSGSGLSTRLALDLHDLARHNRIEHDGSLVHADAAPGKNYAPVVPDPVRLTEVLDAGSADRFAVRDAKPSKGALTFLDFARVRFLRDRALVRPLDRVHAEITRGEVALILLAMSEGDESANAGEHVIPRARLSQWFGEERLPDGWAVPRTQIGLLRTASLGRKVGSECARLARYSS
ncbi:Cloroperoxidase [Phellopilus nigrolimitatus]|nr:Cloroperoxidase [Phellopilus nigrolimitatus]KAH8117676.1 Cloroperoxidase [Phellopilus nigrolimitatus]